MRKLSWLLSSWLSWEAPEALWIFHPRSDHAQRFFGRRPIALTGDYRIRQLDPAPQDAILQRRLALPNSAYCEQGHG